MIWLSSLNAYLSCLPITKIQFEYFLCDTTEARFGAEFYERLLASNPRVSPGKIAPENFYRAIATGVTVEEAEAFAEWCGDDRDEIYSLPTRREWYDAYKELKRLPALGAEEWIVPGMTGRAESLFRRIDAAAARVQALQGNRTAGDSLLLQRGVYEWVRCEDNTWRCAGLPHPDLGAGIIVLDHEKPREVHENKYCGFRLLKRNA